MFNYIKRFVFVYFTLAFAVSLSAATATQNINYTFSNSLLGPNPLTSSSVSQTINQFNPSLGTLNSINVSYFATLQSGSATFFAGTPVGIYNVIGNYQPSLIVPAAVPLNIFAFTPILSVPVTGTGGFGSFSSSPPVTVATTLSLSALTPYIGAGTINLVNSGIFSFTNLTDEELASQSFTMVVNTGATIVYNYTPAAAVPEPGTWLLLGSTLAVGLLLKKRRDTRPFLPSASRPK